MLVGKVGRIVSPFDSFNHQLERLSNYSNHSTRPVLIIKHGKMIIGIPNVCKLEKKRKTCKPHQPTSLGKNGESNIKDFFMLPFPTKIKT